MNILRFDNPDALAQAAADRFVRESNDAIRERGRFLVALSGGSTPILMYRKLRSMPIQWTRTFVFWSDERFVPPEDAESNEGNARRALLDHVTVPKENVFGMFGPGSPGERAGAYERTIRSFGGEMDLTLLGMGGDGHTASLFPGSDSLGERTKWVVASKSPSGVGQRLSFTFPLIGRSRCVLLLVAGADKAAAWVKAERGEDIPVTRLISEAPNLNVYLSL